MSRVTPLRFIRPQLATSVDQPPEGENWIHEIKHDGYRCQVLLEGGRARVLTRTGLDWSEHYPAIVNAAANLDCQSAIIDGEAVIQDENGISDFEALRSALWRCPDRLILYTFDLMHLNGRDLRQGLAGYHLIQQLPISPSASTRSSYLPAADKTVQSCIIRETAIRGR